MKSPIDMRARERGAVRIQTVLTLVAIAIIAFAVYKIALVYIEQRNLETKVYELARISAVRGYKPDQINKAIESLVSENNLKAGDISIVVLAENKVHIKLKYTRAIDFLVAQYEWAVDYTAEGKAL